MLTKEQFADFYANNRDKLNEAFRDASTTEQDEYVKWLDDLTPAEVPDEDSPLAAIEALATVEPTAEEVAKSKAEDDIVAGLLKNVLPASNAAVMARKRAQRSNMLRAVRARFHLLEPFTISECAAKLGRDKQEVAMYLVGEIQRGTGSFTFNPDNNTFFLDNPFV